MDEQAPCVERAARDERAGRGDRVRRGERTDARRRRDEQADARRPHDERTGARRPHDERTGARRPHDERTGARRRRDERAGAEGEVGPATGESGGAGRLASEQGLSDQVGVIDVPLRFWPEPWKELTRVRPEDEAEMMTLATRQLLDPVAPPEDGEPAFVQAGGPPGAGKSSVLPALLARADVRASVGVSPLGADPGPGRPRPGAFAVIDIDDFYRYHRSWRKKEGRYTDERTGETLRVVPYGYIAELNAAAVAALAEPLLREALRRRVNILFQAHRVGRAATQATLADYRTVFAYVTAPLDLLVERVAGRARAVGLFVTHKGNEVPYIQDFRDSYVDNFHVMSSHFDAFLAVRNDGAPDNPVVLAGDNCYCDGRGRARVVAELLEIAAAFNDVRPSFL